MAYGGSTPAEADQTAAGQAPAPPVSAAGEARLLHDPDHKTLLVDVLSVVGRLVSRDLSDRLAGGDREHRVRVELSHGRVPAGPGDPGEPHYGAPPSRRAVLTYQQLRARISTLAVGRACGAETEPQADPGDISALRFLASCLAEAQRCVSSLSDRQQPIASGWVDWLRSRCAALCELVAVECDEAFSGAVLPSPRLPDPVRAPVRLLLDHL